ncbi:hypothetical protein ACFYRY_42125 [Streptomyces sp. NPDC005263]|uniref:hypothetical protein n=1 Tax=Streptomyces sp. NPDC005263 TaxID=3364711 RepID=UPI003699610C
MTVPIDVPAALIFVASCVVGYAVYRHTRTTSTAIPQVGDPGVAFAAGLVALTALSFLFGVTPERHETPPDRNPAVVENSTPPDAPSHPGPEVHPAPPARSTS